MPGYLPRLKNDLLNLLLASENNTLRKLRLNGRREMYDHSIMCQRLPRRI